MTVPAQSKVLTVLITSKYILSCKAYWRLTTSNIGRCGNFILYFFIAVRLILYFELCLDIRFW